MAYESYNGLRVVQFVNCISLEGLGVYTPVHDPYDSYGSWNIGLRFEQFVKCISLERLRECIYKSTTRTGREAMVYESYSLSLQRLECIYKSTTRTSLSSRVTMVYESFGWCFAYQSDLVSLINKSTSRTTRTGRETRVFVSHGVRHTNIAYLIILVRSRCRIL